MEEKEAYMNWAMLVCTFLYTSRTSVFKLWHEHKSVNVQHMFASPYSKAIFIKDVCFINQMAIQPESA